MRTDLLILPGYGNSGPRHWQSHWARLYENSSRVLQEDWETPRLRPWLERLEGAVANGAHPAILAAHSRGCALAAHWAAKGAHGRVKGLLLVGPSDVEAPDFPAEIRGDFAPLPRAPLGLPTILVASADDPYCSLPRAQELARLWGAELVEIGARGHINSDSGLGEWPEGQALLAKLTARAEAPA